MIQNLWQDGSGLEAELAGKAMAKSHLLALTVEEVRIWTGSFASRERGDREGFVQVEVNGQTTLLPYAGRAPGGESLALTGIEKVVFFGPNPGVLDFDIRVVETNEATRQALTKVETITDLIGALPVPAFPAVTAPAAGLLGAICRMIRAGADDADEAVLLTSFAGPVREGQVLTLQAANSRGPITLLRLRCHDLGPVQGEAMAINVTVAAPRFDWTAPQLTVTVPSRNLSSRERTSIEVSHLDYVKQLGFKQFTFEAVSGRHHRTLALPTAAMTDALSWQRCHCFKVNRTKSAANRIAIPLQITFALTRDDIATQDLTTASNSLAQLLRAADAPLPTEVEYTRKHLPSFLSQLADLTPQAVPLATFDGIALLLPADSPPLPQVGGYIPIVQGDDGWTATITQKVSLPGHPECGSFSFDVAFG